MPLPSRLPWIVPVALLAACTTTERAVQANPSDLTLPDLPIQALWRPSEPFHVLVDASVAVAGGKWILAGVEQPMSEDIFSESGALRVVHQDLGVLPTDSPFAAPGRRQLLVPVPPSEGGAWGVLWADAVPPAGTDPHRWPPRSFNHLLFAEWAGGGWGSTRTVLRTDITINWEVAHTILMSRGRGPLLVTTVLTPGKWTLQFGSIPSGVKSVPLAPAVVPLAASFVLDARDRAVSVVFAERRDGPARSHAFALTREQDGGRGWSDPEVFWPLTADVIGGLRALIDSAGRLHVLWSHGLGEDRIHHLSSDTGRDWVQETMDEPGGVVVKWVAGIGRLGQPVILRHVLTSWSSMELQLGRWDGSWSFAQIAPGTQAKEIFEGIGDDGAWYVGWSGFSRGQTDSRSTTWMAIP